MGHLPKVSLLPLKAKRGCEIVERLYSKDERLNHPACPKKIGMLSVSVVASLLCLLLWSPYIEAQTETQRLEAEYHRHMNAGETAYNINARNAGSSYDEAEREVKAALSAAEKVFEPDDPRVARALLYLGRIYTNQRRYAEAEASLKRSLAIREKVLGRAHRDTAQSRNALAMLYHSQGRYAEAERMYKEALQHGDPSVFTYVTGNLVQLYLTQGRYAEAESLAKRVLAYWEKVELPGQAGRQSPGGLNAAKNLAAVYRAEGKNQEAERVLRNYQAKPQHQAVSLCDAVKPGPRLSVHDATDAVKRALAEHPDINMRCDISPPSWVAEHWSSGFGTPLHSAIINVDPSQQGRRTAIGIVDLLLVSGADVNAMDQNRCTPLHAAAVVSVPEFIFLLLKHGADVNAKNKHGKSPLDLATDPKIIVLLKRYASRK
jgi:tetratricopeptide (TPR) repeat protein